MGTGAARTQTSVLMGCQRHRCTTAAPGTSFYKKRQSGFLCELFVLFCFYIERQRDRDQDPCAGSLLKCQYQQMAAGSWEQKRSQGFWSQLLANSPWQAAEMLVWASSLRNLDWVLNSQLWLWSSPRYCGHVGSELVDRWISPCNKNKPLKHQRNKNPSKKQTKIIQQAIQTPLTWAALLFHLRPK